MNTQLNYKNAIMYYDYFVDRELSIQFGKIPIIPNAVERDILSDYHLR